MLYIETELAGYRERAKSLLSAIARREAFIETINTNAAEARKLHGEALANEQRELAEVQALIDKQEKALGEASVVANDNSELIQSPS